MRLPLLGAAVVIVLPALALPFVPISSLVTAPATASMVTPPAMPDPSSPLVGTYDCQGVEPDGTAYQGVVQIIPNRGTYDVIWIFSSGQQYAGLGVVNGDVLAVSYFTNRPGVVAYRIEQGDKGPRLQGQWTVVGAGAAFHETLTRLTSEVKRPTAPAQPPREKPKSDLRPLRPLRHLRPA